ncbi:MAG: outer membrane beta-barrel protein [Bacteroidetes bacterium]|nr:outer membrane beta-barrel protein [Bacteroidota bacterium]
MKTKNIIIISLALLVVVGLNTPILSQNMMDSQTIKEARITEAFNKILVNNGYNVILEQSAEMSIIVEAAKDFQNSVKISVVNGELRLMPTSGRKPLIFKVYINAPEIDEINLFGNSSLQSKGIISQQKMELKTFGTAMLNLEIEVGDLHTESHSASEIILNGKATNHIAELQGASKLIASKLLAENTIVETNTTSKAIVNTTNELEITSNGSSRVEYYNIPKNVKRHNTDDVHLEYNLTINDDEDEIDSKLHLGSLDMRFHESRDSTIVNIGRHSFAIDTYGNTRYRSNNRNNFKSNWSGILIGVNGYLTPQNDMNFPEDYDYLDLNIAKSIRFDLNIWEQNIEFTKDHRFGMATGLGFEFRNYQFNKNVTLVGDQPEIAGYINEGLYIKKTKLVATYLNIPFLLEYQTTSNYRNRDGFHISAGMVFGLRIGSHTKIKTQEKNKEYTLIDPVSNEVFDTRTTPNRARIKEFGSFHLNPFKIEAMFMIGWGWVNLYATYSLTTLFKDNHGPELYPFSIGLSLLKW